MFIYLSCYHKTGTVFLIKLKKLLEIYDKKNTYKLDCWSKRANKINKKNNKNIKIIHLIRHPYEIIVSGFNYHKKCKESWCIDINSKTGADGIKYSFDNMCYQDKLKSLEMEAGINFEMHGRSYNTIIDLYNSKFFDCEYCLNIKMENLYINEIDTIKQIIQFIGIKSLINKDYSSIYFNKSINHITNKDKRIDLHLNYFNDNNYIMFQKLFGNLDLGRYNYNYNYNYKFE